MTFGRLSTMALIGCASTLGACTSSPPWVISNVTMQANPGPCNSTTGLVENVNIGNYIPTAAAHDKALNCAIARVTVVPGPGNAKAGPNIFLYTTYNDQIPDKPMLTLVADYQLPAPLPAASPKQQTFLVIAGYSGTAFGPQREAHLE